MHLINRQVAIIKPRKPYVDWINSLQGATGEPSSIESLKRDCTAVLMPEDLDTDEESLDYLKKIHKKIFDIELHGWCTDKKFWPKKRDVSLFIEWFDCEFHSEIFDSLETDIEKEEY